MKRALLILALLLCLSGCENEEYQPATPWLVDYTNSLEDKINQDREKILDLEKRITRLEKEQYRLPPVVNFTPEPVGGEPNRKRLYEIEAFMPDGSVRQYKSWADPFHHDGDDAWRFPECDGRYIELYGCRPVTITERWVPILDDPHSGEKP